MGSSWVSGSFCLFDKESGGEGPLFQNPSPIPGSVTFQSGTIKLFQYIKFCWVVLSSLVARVRALEHLDLELRNQRLLYFCNHNSRVLPQPRFEVGSYLVPSRGLAGSGHLHGTSSPRQKTKSVAKRCAAMRDLGGEIWPKVRQCYLGGAP